MVPSSSPAVAGLWRINAIFSLTLRYETPSRKHLRAKRDLYVLLKRFINMLRTLRVSGAFIRPLRACQVLTSPLSRFPTKHNSLPASLLTTCKFYTSGSQGKIPFLYKDVFEQSVRDPERFWGDAASQIDWYKPYSRVLDDRNSPFSQW